MSDKKSSENILKKLRKQAKKENFFVPTQIYPNILSISLPNWASSNIAAMAFDFRKHRMWIEFQSTSGEFIYEYTNLKGSDVMMRLATAKRPSSEFVKVRESMVHFKKIPGTIFGQQ